MQPEYSTEELAKLAEAGFVMNEHGEMVLPVASTVTGDEDSQQVQFEATETKPSTGVLIAMPGAAESILRILGKL